MSDFTIDDTMADIHYDLDEREIYNDVRAEIGITNSETIIDADPLYEWKYFMKTTTIGVQMGDTVFDTFGCTAGNAVSWKIKTGYFAWYYTSTYDRYDYYDYSIWIESHTASKCVVGHKNTGVWSSAKIQYGVGYRYLVSEGSSHEETTYNTLTARTTDATSIQKYGRRVMNLTWPQGVGADEMQSLADKACAKHAEPVPRATVKIIGDTVAKIAIIQSSEVSLTVDLSCAYMGLTATVFYINSIRIKGDPTGIPVGTLVLEQQRSSEANIIFKLGVSKLGGAHVLG